MSDNLPDKYPDDSSRRRFVRGVVGASALAGLSTASMPIVESLTSEPGAGGGATVYRGAENIGGPAPRGLPQVPVEVDDEGFLRGIWPDIEMVEREGIEVPVATMEIAGQTYTSEWFHYCGIQSAPGLSPDADRDNYLRYSASSNYDWQNEQVEGGQRVSVVDFDDYEEWAHPIGSGGLGKGAQTNWRSQDERGGDVLPVQVIRSPIVEEMAEQDDWLGATTDQGFIAFLNKCTHFCCVPGWKTYRDSVQYDADDLIYCQCHQSVFDPFSIVTETFFAFPRPED
ncbi:MAG: ubiquinol-cytochrome c reductase iron-sulfur subunit [Halobacteriota archaeon]